MNAKIAIKYKHINDYHLSIVVNCENGGFIAEKDNLTSQDLVDVFDYCGFYDEEPFGKQTEKYCYYMAKIDSTYDEIKEVLTELEYNIKNK